MATVKILLDNNESEEEAREMLIKALMQGETGSAHQETFTQPAGRAIFEKMQALHDQMMDEMLKEIFSTLTTSI